MAYIDSKQATGITPDGNQIPIPIGAKATATSKALAPNEVWQSEIYWYNGNNNIQLAISSDVTGTYLIEYFTKEESKVAFMGNTVIFDPSLLVNNPSPTNPGAFQAGIAGKSDGVRITYSNGVTAQSVFYCEIGLLNQPIQETLRSMGLPMGATNLGGTTHAAIEGREYSTGGAFKQVTTTQIEAKTALDVNVINRSNEDQKVLINNDTPIAVTIIGMESGEAPNGMVSVVNFPENQGVTVSNFPEQVPFPSSIEISNFPENNSTIEISNFPEIQNVNFTNDTIRVTGNFYPETQIVHVDNFPSSQNVVVTSPIEINNEEPINVNVTFPTNQNVTVSNLPLNQTVSGSVSVSNFPSSTTISNFPVIQAISASTLPLPTNASTSAKQDVGNTSLASIDSDLGNITDIAVLDPTASASVISLLKGLLQETVAQASTGSFTAYSLIANTAQTIPAQLGRKTVKIFSVSGTILIGVGFTATASNFSYRIVTNGMVEILVWDAPLAISLFSTAASTVNVSTSI